MAKKGFLSRVFSKTEKTIGKTKDFLIDPAVKEFEDLGGDFNHLTDRFLKRLLKEDWPKLSGIKVKDVMEKPTLVKSTATVKQIKTKLKSHEDILFVVNDKKKILGFIDEVDLVILLVPAEKITSIVGVMGSYYNKVLFGKTAKDFMRTHLYVVTPNTPIEKVAYIMNKEKLKGLPVVKRKKIVGIIHVRNLVGKIK